MLRAQEVSPLFKLLDAERTGIGFVNRTKETPEDFAWTYEYLFNGSGISVADFNADGLADLFFTGYAGPNALYLNQGNFNFKEVTASAGIAATGKFATGSTVVDINQDGLMDIYVCYSGSTFDAEARRNELYLHQGFSADGTPQFEEVANSYGIADSSRSTQAVFFDMENDGDLDLYVLNHTHPLYNKQVGGRPLPPNMEDRIYRPVSNRLFRNEGNANFTDITNVSGVYLPGFALGVAVRDFDENGYLDIYVSNDYSIPDYFWMNNGDGTFSEAAKKHFKHTAFFGMGCDAADINNDGLEDLTNVDMTSSDHVRSKTLMPTMNVDSYNSLTEKYGYLKQNMFNALQLNRGGGKFSEIGNMAGVALSDWSWAPLLADFDLDGYKDLFISNGYFRDTKDNDQLLKINAYRREKGRRLTLEEVYDHFKNLSSQPIPNRIWKNGGNLQFADKNEEWGMQAESFSSGAVYADLDQDGDLDLVVNNLESPAHVYQNQARQQGRGNYIRFHLKDGNTYHESCNAKVYIYYDDQVQMMENTFVRGYQSTVEPIVHFGIGHRKVVERVDIHWLDGTISSISTPAINQVHVVDKSIIKSRPKSVEPLNQLFVEVNGETNIAYVHRENKFDDFKKETLLPHRQSTLGPALAVADINGDGLEDFYVGGARGQQGVFWVQKADGQFEQQEPKYLLNTKGNEDLDALFFDADGDGDQDLYVASGGDGSFPEGTKWLQDRLYLNDGKGDFSLQADALPAMYTATGTVRAKDWDNDGDLDLFVGGRTTPGKYPFAPNSYLLQNNGSSFEDVTAQLAPELSKIGMVTDAVWVDSDLDGDQDLMVVGEWMPITLLERDGQGFKKKELPKTAGWWYSITAADFDQDGDQDFIVGNLGLNNKFHPLEEKPLHIYTNDFDESGTFDIILSKYYEGEQVPLRGRDCTTQQIPMLKEKFPTYIDFASANMEEIYTFDALSEALHYQVDDFASILLENKGNQNFEAIPLPMEAQMAPCNSVVIEDFDADGFLDVLMGGNMLNTEAETPSYDAGKGLVLLGGADNTFSSIPQQVSGLQLDKNLKKIAPIKLGSSFAFIAGNNNDVLQVYRLKKR